MYSYLEDKNLNDIYDYLIKNNMYDKFIEAIINENALYQEMLKDIIKYKKELKTDK